MSLPRRKGPKITVPAPVETPPRSPANEPSILHPDLDSRASMVINGHMVDVAHSDLRIVETLGRGNYGHVDKVVHLASGFEFAVKRIRATDDPTEKKRMLMDLEVNIKSGGKCPYIVKSFGALFGEGDLWICMEIMDGSLETFYRKVFAAQQTIPEYILGHIAFCMISGLGFLKNELNILHRDVKPSNVLLSKTGDVKLCDFGISGQLVQSIAKTRNVGCSLYMPPERVDPDKADLEGFGVQSDVWSLGITMIEIATGVHPFAKWINPFQQMKQVVSGPPPALPLDQGFSAEFHDFIALCCRKDYEQRPKYPQLLEHPFIVPYSPQNNPEGKQTFAAFVSQYL